MDYGMMTGLASHSFQFTSEITGDLEFKCHTRMSLCNFILPELVIQLS